MRIGVDSDGVLADFDKSMVDGYNEQFGTDLKYKQITHWDAFEELTGWDHGRWWDWVITQHPGVFLDAPPLPGAIDGMRMLKNLGHELAIITAKPKWAGEHMIQWLHQHDVPYDEIHVTNKKTYVSCDVYVDDAIHNCVAFLEHTDGLVIQYAAYPYVNGGRRVPGAYYATSWDEVIDLVSAHDYNLSVEYDQTARAIREALQGVFN